MVSFRSDEWIYLYGIIVNYNEFPLNECYGDELIVLNVITITSYGDEPSWMVITCRCHQTWQIIRKSSKQSGRVSSSPHEHRPFHQPGFWSMSFHCDLAQGCSGSQDHLLEGKKCDLQRFF